jgi:EAL domain-containing protein (putative c-di-GMP-specific phosphodiesterase class I)
LLSPDKFIPLAEESGVIVEMGLWILTEACQQMKTWQESGLFGKKANISVNLSGKQFDQSNLVDEIERVFQETGLSLSCLELEITETIMMRSTDNSTQQLAHLRELGVKVAIDDFGTGYSSLSYLKHLPITRLKIDRAFISDIPEDKNDAAISKAIISMAKNLSFDVLAEGIETEEQQNFLIQHDCRKGQGFLFAPPLVAPDFEFFMLSKRGSQGICTTNV